MKKTKSTVVLSLLIIFLALLFIGCSKSDKDVTKKDDATKMDQKKTVENQKTDAFYGTSDLKFWQNYPGKSPNGDTDLSEVKDTAQVQKIKMSIAGHSNEDVYTCEMHPTVFQNHPGKCPKCKMDMMKLKDYIKNEHEKKHEELEEKWEGKPNAVHKEFKVPNTKCIECEKLIESAISKDKGVLDVMVDSENKTVHLFFDKTKTNLDDVEKIVLGAGFDVENKKGDSEVQKTLPDCCK